MLDHGLSGSRSVNLAEMELFHKDIERIYMSTAGVNSYMCQLEVSKIAYMGNGKKSK